MSVESKKIEKGSFLGFIQPGKDRIVIGRVFDPNFGEDQILVDMDFTITNVSRDSTVPILPGFEDFLSKLQEDKKKELEAPFFILSVISIFFHSI
jgi:hypothetical protein